MEGGGEPGLDLRGGVADLAFEHFAGGVVGVEDGDEEVLAFEFVDDLGDDADSCVWRGHGAVAAWDGEGEDYVDAALFADAREGVDDAVGGVVEDFEAHAAFVEDEGEAVRAVFLLEEFGDGSGAEEAVGFFVEAEGEDDGAGWVPVLGE